LKYSFFLLLLEGTTKRGIEKAWRQFLQRVSQRPDKGTQRPTYQVFSKEYLAINCIIPSVTDDRMKIIATIFDSHDGVRLTVQFEADNKPFGPETNPQWVRAGRF
jgi:hypothetical protein